MHTKIHSYYTVFFLILQWFQGRLKVKKSSQLPNAIIYWMTGFNCRKSVSVHV